MIVAQALNNQKLVLDQITALNTTTSDLIQRTSELLRDNSAPIQKQAASATVGLPQLQAAFANIYATMDSIDAFKMQALTSMARRSARSSRRSRSRRSYLDRVSRPTSGSPRARSSSRVAAGPDAALTRSVDAAVRPIATG